MGGKVAFTQAPNNLDLMDQSVRLGRSWFRSGQAGKNPWFAWLMVGLIIGGAAGGIAGFALAYEPPLATYSLSGPPWILSLGAGQFAVVFTNVGVGNSAVFFGVVDINGAWISWPLPVTPIEPGGTRGPSGVTARLDDEGSVHLAWALWDSPNDLQTYHYLQLDASGSKRLAREVWGESLKEVYGPVPVGLRIEPDQVQIASPVNNSYFRNETPTYMVSTLDYSGTPTESPYPVSDLDEASYFPPRRLPPGVTQRQSGDSDASIATDERGNTFYLWIDFRSWFVGRTYFSERDLRFDREGSAGSTTRILYSTEDTWWLTKAPVLPSVLGFILAGGAGGGLFYLRRRRRLH